MRLPEINRRLAHCSIIMLICSLFAACSEDSPYPSVTTNFVDAVTDERGQVTEIRTDNGITYKAEPQMQAGCADSVLRCICVYEVAEQEKTEGYGTTAHASAHIYSIRHIFSDEPEVRAAFSVYPQDPVKVTSVWRGGGYINMHLGILTTDVAAHPLAFCEDSITTSGTGRKSVYLSLLHLRPENDADSYTEKTYASMPTHKYSEMDTIVFRINSYEGMREFKWNN
ncbi:MAG: hypothetical protein NC206_07310 [Bacteroides sp.]|nr:hypothetical protein [Roseburia sp.]MCM1346879.1 hypothetical protein [Bacteroides sp.]MCM1421422.1 hypothetical protein [Bacteroides sp.]